MGCAALFTFIALFLISPSLHAQKAENGRKVVVRVKPDYPGELKRAYIGGHVRLDVTVTPNGTVDSVTVVGGNPILAESASKAVKKWKYASSDAWSTLQVAFDFDPRHD
jgi:TonB family protein